MPQQLSWNSDGSQYLITFETMVEVRSAATNAVLGSLQKSKYVKVLQARFFACEHAHGVIVLFDDKSFALYDSHFEVVRKPGPARLWVMVCV